jgi:hypothetical protein
MTSSQILSLELYALDLKYEYMVDFKNNHRDILEQFDRKLQNNTPLPKLKTWLLNKLKELYAPVVTSIVDLSKETFELMHISPSLYIQGDITAMGLTVDELIKSRILTHFKAMISSAVVKGSLDINKIKKTANNSTVSITTDYLSTVRDTAYRIIESKQDTIIGWLYSSILDRRTTTLCISLNNKFYSIDTYKDRSALPYTPNVNTHPRCRSILLTIYDHKDIKRYKDISLDEFLLSDEHEAIKRIGKTKYKLFKDGKLKAVDIFNYKDRKFFTNKEIKERLRL